MIAPPSSRPARLLGCLTLVLLIAFPRPARSQALDDWSWRSQVPTSHGVRSIAEGGGVLVAVADGPTFLRSTDDGGSWEPIVISTPSITLQLLDIAYGASTFVAVGNAQQVFTSPDGQTWTPRSAGSAGDEFRSVVHAAGLFVLAGTDAAQTGGVLLTSPDGITWTARSGGVTGPFNELVHENGEFIACGGLGAGNGWVTTSANGTSWTPLTTTLAVPPASVTHGLSKYWALSPSYLFSSTDGSVWTGGIDNSLATYQQVRAFGGKLVSFERASFFTDSVIRTSTDGSTWTPDGSVSKVHQLKVLGSTLYALSGPETFNRASQTGVHRSSDAASWESLHEGRHEATPLKAVVATAGGFRVAGPDRAGVLGGNTNPYLFDFDPAALLDLGSSTVAGGSFGIHTTSDGTNYSQVGFTAANDLASNGSIHVSVGDQGAFTSSTDGSFWSDLFTGLTEDYEGVCFGGGKFVAVGDGGAVATSTDGTSWSPVASGQPGNFTGVAHGAGTFVAVGDGGVAMSSADGSSWTARTSGTHQSLRRVRFLAGKFRAVGKGGTLVESTDGTSWTTVPVPTCLDLCDIAEDGGGFRIVGQGSVILESDDGTTWVVRHFQPFSTFDEMESIHCAGGGFHASGDLGGLSVSSNGKSWTFAPVTNFPRVYDIASHEGTIVGVGQMDGADSVIATSTDNGVTWTTQNLGILGSFEGVTWGNGVFVAVGEDSYATTSSVVASSPDGLAWTVHDPGTDLDFLDVTFGNGTFVAVNGGPNVYTSPDGASWTERTNAAPGGLRAVLFANGMFAGGANTMYTSTDGITWTMTDTVVGAVNGIAHGAGTWLAVSDGGYIHSSTDGASWTQRSSPTFYKLWDVAFGADTFVAVGYNGTILQSGFLASSPPTIDWISDAFTIDMSGDYLASATVKGRGPIAYQWFKDGVAIPGATDYFLRLPSGGDHGGDYHLVATNEFGQATSAPLTFVVIEPEMSLEVVTVDLLTPEIQLRVNAPLDQSYDLYVIPIPGPAEWQYWDSIYVYEADQAYFDYPDVGATGRLYQLRESEF